MSEHQGADGPDRDSPQVGSQAVDGSDTGDPDAGGSGADAAGTDVPRADGVDAPQRALGLLRAMGHPIRSSILRVMGTGIPMRVSDIAEDLSEPANRISYHLRQLAKVGIIHNALPDGAIDGRETWWVYDRTVRLRAGVDAIRALPGGEMALAAFQDLEAQRTLDLFSLRRLEEAQASDLPRSHGSGYADLTRAQAQEITDAIFGAFEKSLEMSRENSRQAASRRRQKKDGADASPGASEGAGADGEEEVHRYEFRLAFLPTAE